MLAGLVLKLSGGELCFAGKMSSLVALASSRTSCSTLGVGELVAWSTAASNAAASEGVGRAAPRSLKSSAYTTCASSATFDSPPTGVGDAKFMLIASFGTIAMAIPRKRVMMARRAASSRAA